MEIFKLETEGFQIVKRRIFFRAFPLILITMTAGYFISQPDHSTQATNNDALLILIPTALIIVAFSLYRSYKIEYKKWHSYSVKFDGDSVSREQKNIPTQTIHKSEIKEIIETSDGYIVKTKQSERFIGIPKSIQSRERVVQLLSQLAPITKNQSAEFSKYTLLIGVITVGLMLTFYRVTLPVIIIPTGLILSIGLVYSFIKIQRSKHLEKRIKIYSYAMIPAILPIIARLIQEFVKLGS